MAVGNYVSLIGRLTNSPACFENQDGSKKYKMTVAVQQDFKNKDGEYGTDFIEVEAFVPASAKADPWSNLTKGTLAAYEGTMRSGRYEKDGETVYTQTVNLSRVKFLEPKRTEGAAPAAEAAPVAAAADGGVPMIPMA